MADGVNGVPVEGQVDVRTLSTGLLLYNLMVCVVGLQINGRQLAQIRMIAQAQKLVGLPPEVAGLEREIMEQSRSAKVMVANLEARFAKFDRDYWEFVGVQPPPPDERSTTPPASEPGAG